MALVLVLEALFPGVFDPEEGLVEPGELLLGHDVLADGDGALALVFSQFAADQIPLVLLEVTAAVATRCVQPVSGVQRLAGRARELHVL